MLHVCIGCSLQQWRKSGIGMGCSIFICSRQVVFCHIRKDYKNKYKYNSVLKINSPPPPPPSLPHTHTVIFFSFFHFVSPLTMLWKKHRHLHHAIWFYSRHWLEEGGRVGGGGGQRDFYKDKTEVSAKILNGFQLLTSSANCFVLDMLLSLG